jgi:hypothetical protein
MLSGNERRLAVHFVKIGRNGFWAVQQEMLELLVRRWKEVTI